MNWKEKIEAQIASLRAAYCTEDADAMQALLDVAVAADAFMGGPPWGEDTVELDNFCAALDKLREVSDE